MRSIKRQLDLIIQLTISSFKLRNEGSYLGIVWYLLNPLLMFLLLYVIFSGRLGSNIENYEMYLFLGLIQWNFINLAVSTSMKNILLSAPLIKSLNFNREALVISSALMALVAHLFELIIFTIFLVLFGIKPILIILFPFIILLQFLFTLGMCFALSSLVIYFKDLENIWQFVSRLWWFLTPIFYSISKDSGVIYTVNLFNPVYYIIDISRDLIIYSSFPKTSSLIILSIFTVVSFSFGYIIFKKLKTGFAEMV